MEKVLGPCSNSLNIMTLSSTFIYRHALHLNKNDTNIIIRNKIHSHNTRNKNNINLPYKRLTKSQSTPSIMARKLYNKNPEKIREMNKNQFKKTIHKFLVKNSFYDIKEFMDTLGEELGGDLLASCVSVETLSNHRLYDIKSDCM
ncbi:hypothetical protein O3M35_002137 [Rhynocoris fuscipes]|uniref:Uncharacterized protein n=1 Tax=Rhynocoris fuscipes TaxID=488301 RepID=A0AAW1CU12_9HEMI